MQQTARLLIVSTILPGFLNSFMRPQLWVHLQEAIACLEKQICILLTISQLAFPNTHSFPTKLHKSKTVHGLVTQRTCRARDWRTSIRTVLSRQGRLTNQHMYVISNGENSGPQEAYELHDSVLEGHASNVASIQNHIPHSVNLSLTPYTNQHNTRALGDTPGILETSIGPPYKQRKRKAPRLRPEAWKQHKARIIELHIQQDLPLREVKETMKREFGFVAEYVSFMENWARRTFYCAHRLTLQRLRQYRTRISQWGLDKNIKPQEMKAIVRKRQRRKLVDRSKRTLTFTVRGNEVDEQKIDRWMKRNGIPEDELYTHSPAACKLVLNRCCSYWPLLTKATPPAVFCRTVSERGSPVPRFPVQHSQQEFWTS